MNKTQSKINRRKRMSDNPVPPVPPVPVTPPTETVGEAVEVVVTDVQGDITASESAVNTAIGPLWAKAKAEFDSLEPAAQRRIHALIADVETAYATALPALHSALGGKKPA
jgi:hypothetical protein